MYVVIIESKEHNVFVESDVDAFCPLYNTFEGDIAASNYEIFEDNSGPGKLFPSRPVFNFEGREILTMVRYSEKSSITNEILTDILHTLGDLKVFQVYCNQGAVPLLLVDGHQSRFSKVFLEYITNSSHL